MQKTTLNSIPIITYETIDSTSKTAHKLLQANQAEDGTIIWAKIQTDGHGRYGRNWQSDIGNLSFSFIIKSQFNLNQVTTYPFIAALAIKEALKNYLNKKQLENLKFKWPNDILYKGKKIGGIILESSIENNLISNIICGIGLNVKSAPANLTNTSSLLENNIEITDLKQLIYQIYSEFNNYLEQQNIQGAEFIYNAWLENAYNLNHQIIVTSNQNEYKGIFIGIKDGNLLIRNTNDEITKIITGDVFFSKQEQITVTS